MKAKINKLEYQKSVKQYKIIKLKNKLLNIIARFTIIPKFRILMYKMMGIKIGKNVSIMMDCYLDDEVPKLVTIEDDVIISFRVTIVAHEYNGEKLASPIIIKKGSYIGTGAIILSGVTVGENSIVAAGAVVTKDIADNIVAGGVPAVKIKDRI